VTADAPKPQIDTSKPHPARVYDYLLGGKDNYVVDQQVGEKLPEEAKVAARQNRAFMQRAVAWLAHQGIDQFLDIGTGIPTANNTHEVAQSLAPDSRIVYVDNDPVVLLHARALLTSNREGACAYVDADFRDPDKILAEAAKLIDFRRPVALMLLGILQLIPDKDDPWGAVKTLLAALAPGSYLAITHPAGDIDPRSLKAAAVLDTMSVEKRTLRRRADVARFFDGLDMLPPGLVQVSKWRPESQMQASAPASRWAGIGRKPGGSVS
jgi:hypothetical protein